MQVQPQGGLVGILRNKSSRLGSHGRQGGAAGCGCGCGCGLRAAGCGLRTADSGKRPRLACAHDATPAGIEQALAAGARHYLTKPVKLAGLLQVLDELLEAMDTQFG